MKTRIINIGNSRGIRIPKMLLDELALTGEVDLLSVDGTLVIRPATPVRQGWAEAAEAVHAESQDGLIDTAATDFEAEDWTWD